MKNAKDVKQTATHKFLMLGPTGSGKTTQFLTLPGKKFAYLFDPNAKLSLRGHDVDYEEFLPSDVSLHAVSLTKGKGDPAAPGAASGVYLDWEKDYQKKRDSGFFLDYKWLMVDSATTFLDIVMDRILTINGRPGQWPNQDDYGPQMLTFTKIVRELTANNIGLYFTGHLQMDQNPASKMWVAQPLMTGRLREKIPLLFSDIFVTEAYGDAALGSVSYNMRTAPDRTYQTVRSSFKGWDHAKKEVIGLDLIEDVTLNFHEPLEMQGLGKILTWEKEYTG